MEHWITWIGLGLVLWHCCKKQKQDGGRFSYCVGHPKPKEINMLGIAISNEEKVNVKIVPVTTTGKPARVDGVPTWEVVEGASSVVPAADGLSADLISGDDPGQTRFLVKADADLGAGVIEISDEIVLEVSGAQAANLGLVAGTPQPK